jgi:glycerophosphoryl diester phosphodiesterase
MEAAVRVPGCDGLEFDIRSSMDGVPVILHDETLARVQRIPAKCVTLTAAELAEHGIPTLGQVLGAVGCDPFLDVELKEPVQGAIDALELERGRIDDDGGAVLRNAVVSSFDASILQWLASQQPAWPRWLNAYDLSDGTIRRAVDIGCAVISAERHAIDADAVARSTDAGLGVAAWTVRDPAEYARLEAFGLVAICVEAAALET